MIYTISGAIQPNNHPNKDTPSLQITTPMTTSAPHNDPDSAPPTIGFHEKHANKIKTCSKQNKKSRCECIIEILNMKMKKASKHNECVEHLNKTKTIYTKHVISHRTATTN